MNSKPLVLLDTSIQIERLIGAARERRVIEQHLATAHCQFVSSSYVFMKFQRSVLADYVRVYITLLEHRSWEETAQALRSGPLGYRPRSLGRCLQILTQTMTISRLEWDDALALLKAQIRYDLPHRFWLQVDRLPDQIVCDLVVTGITVGGGSRFSVANSCRKETAACFLPDFLHGHRAELQAIVAYLGAHPQTLKNQARIERLLENVVIDPHAALGQSACWPLGDLIIVLQAFPDKMVWSLDADFDPLLQALGLSRYTPTLA